MRKIMILANYDVGLYNFRHELIQRLLLDGNKVVIVLPYGEKISFLVQEGCIFHEIKIDRRGTNIWKEMQLFYSYWRVVRQEIPDVVLTYTIKPNIYGSFVSGMCKIPCIVNITGLGSAIENRGGLGRLSLFLYKQALKRTQCVFFQNKENMDFFKKEGIVRGMHELLPGSGVNIETNQLQEYPSGKTIFLFAGRLMKEKGIEEYLCAAKEIKSKYVDVEFHICGFCEEGYVQKIESLQKKGIVVYHGMVNDMEEIYGRMSCLIHPSYHEGMSNVLMEAAAAGRPGIASDISGCREIVKHEVTGFLFQRKNRLQLCEMIERFINMSYEDKTAMGMSARKRMERYFDRNIVVERYLKAIQELGKKDMREIIFR